MGYKLTSEQVKEKRKPPRARHSPPPIKKSRCMTSTKMITSSDPNVSEKDEIDIEMSCDHPSDASQSHAEQPRTIKKL